MVSTGTAEKRKTKKTKHSKTKKSITSSTKSMQSIQTESEIQHEHVEQMHTFTEPQLQSSRIEHDNLLENTTTELITDSAIEQQLQSIHHSIYPQHEVNAMQTGNEIAPIDMPECKSRAVIDALQPLSVLETNLNESVGPARIDKMPTATNIEPSMIALNRSLTREETLTIDTHDDLRVTESAHIAKAHADYVAFEAKTIDERIVQENESKWTNNVATVKPETADISIESMHPIEVDVRSAEEIVSDLPDEIPVKPASVDFDVSDQHSLNITETVSGQETSPFQPETLAASAKAVTNFELHRPYTVEETHSSENEKAIPLMIAADEKQARINYTCMDSVAIGQPLANEFEGDLILSKPEIAKADDSFKPYETMQTNVIEYFETEDSLRDFPYEMAQAEIEMNEHNIKMTESTNVYQCEEELKPKRRPDHKRATPTFVTLKSSVTEQLVPNESENDLKPDAISVVHATRSAKTAKVLETSSVQPLETVAPEIKTTKDYVEQTAKIEFERLESAMTSSMVQSNEKERELIQQDLKVRPTVRHDIAQITPIESTIVESLDSECAIETEAIQPHQSKSVPGHLLTLGTVNVIEPCDTIDSSAARFETSSTIAKVVLGHVHGGASAYSVLPTEQTTDGIETAKPNHKIASSSLSQQNAVEISTKSAEETITDLYVDSGESKKQHIPVKASEALLQSANVLETYSMENVGDVCDLDNRKSLKVADTQFDEHKQVDVTETVTFEHITSDDYSPKQSSTVHASSQFTQQSAATVSVVLPSESTNDLVCAKPELTEMRIAFDTSSSLTIQEQIGQEAVSEMRPTDTGEPCQSSSSFIPQIANQQMEIDLLENPDILKPEKAERHVGNAGLNDAFIAPEVSNILIHGPENTFDTKPTKTIASAHVTSDNLNAIESVENAVLDTFDTLLKTDSRTAEHVSSTAMQQSFSHTVTTQDVFEKESAFESTENLEESGTKIALEHPLTTVNIAENVELISVEDLALDKIQRVESIEGKKTEKPMHSATKEIMVVYESEDTKPVGSSGSVSTAILNVHPQQYVTVETREINDSAIQLEPSKTKGSKCHITTEPCLPVTLSETIVVEEIPKDRKEIHAKQRTASLKVNETLGIETLESVSHIDCRILHESAKISNEGELHGVEIIENDQIEREKLFASEANEKLTRKATVVNHKTVLQSIQTKEEKVNRHIEAFYQEHADDSKGTHDTIEGKLVCACIWNLRFEFNEGFSILKSKSGFRISGYSYMVLK